MNREEIIASSGVIYCSTSSYYLGLAVESAKSLKRHMPGLRCELHTWEEAGHPIFDSVIPYPEVDFHPKQLKALACLKMPFERNLFLDTDTLVLEPVWALFEILNVVEFAACPFIKHSHPKYTSSAPDTYPEINGGVMAFRRSPRIQKLIERWSELLKDQLEHSGMDRDQPPLREAMWEQQFVYHSLPSEYNHHIMAPMVATGKIRIIHGQDFRQIDLEREAARRNWTERTRVFAPVCIGRLKRFGHVAGPMRFMIRWGKYLRTLCDVLRSHP